MEKEIRQWAQTAHDLMAPHGVTITGAHYYVPRQGQRKIKTLCACLDGTTDNANFFGVEYNNRCRIRLLALAYDAAFMVPGQRLPADDLLLDMRLSLTGRVEGTPFAGLPSTSGKSPEAQFFPVDDMIAKGEIEAGTMLHEYTDRYGISDILIYKGRNWVSPDSSSVELLEDLIRVGRIRSVLEIGAGVGICGVAAQRAGIRDYTFVDASPAVCAYVRKKFPHYKVECADAMTYPLERHWDVILVGIPYQLQPFLLGKRGEDLAASCTTTVFQSGCRAFFDFEHDWLMGNKRFKWPWYNRNQSLARHFPNRMDVSVDWQLAAVASHDHLLYSRLWDIQERKRRTDWYDDDRHVGL